MEYIAVLCTCREEDAGRIARAVLEEKIAACVNIIDAFSLFWWNGRVQEDREKLLVIKSREDMWDALKKKIKEIHSYELPEIIAVPIEYGLEDYLEWIDMAVGKK